MKVDEYMPESWQEVGERVAFQSQVSVHGSSMISASSDNAFAYFVAAWHLRKGFELVLFHIIAFYNLDSLWFFSYSVYICIKFEG